MTFGTINLNDGNKIPAIAYGTGSVWKGTDVKDYVLQAFEVGFSHIDTAAYYRTEGGIGDAIRESGLDRSELYLTTKFTPSLGYTVAESMHRSLSQMGVKSVDLYLIHFPPPDIEHTWKEMEKVREEGLAKSIGLSNYGPEQLEKIFKVAKVKPAVNQIMLHPYNYAQQKPTLDLCTQHGIVIEAFSSLAPITRFPGGPVDKVLDAAAKKRGAAWSQIILLWLKSKDIVIVTTSSKKEDLKQYLATDDLEPLTEEEILAIEQAGAKGPGSRWILSRNNWPKLILAFVLGFACYTFSQHL